jgi:hypothetical protein
MRMNHRNEHTDLTILQNNDLCIAINFPFEVLAIDAQKHGSYSHYHYLTDPNAFPDLLHETLLLAVIIGVVLPVSTSTVSTIAAAATSSTSTTPASIIARLAIVVLVVISVSSVATATSAVATQNLICGTVVLLVPQGTVAACLAWWWTAVLRRCVAHPGWTLCGWHTRWTSIATVALVAALLWRWDPTWWRWGNKVCAAGRWGP